MGRHGGGELPRIGENRRYLRPPMSDTAADGVIGTAMKSCIHLDQKPLRSPKLNNAVLVWSSFGGPRGLWSRYMGCLWMQLFMAVPMTPLAAVSDIDGRRYRRFSPILGSSPPPWRPMFLSPAINLSLMSLSPAITENHWFMKTWSRKSRVRLPLNIEAKRTV